MGFKFKVRDKVRITKSSPMFAGEKGTVTRLGGVATPNKGTVITNEKFPCGDDSYGEHSIWFPDCWLELI